MCRVTFTRLPRVRFETDKVIKTALLLLYAIEKSMNILASYFPCLRLMYFFRTVGNSMFKSLSNRIAFSMT